MARLFLFTEIGESSPAQAALRGAYPDLVVRRLRGTFLDCPLAFPPDLAVIEPAAARNPVPLVPILAAHPVLSRVPWLIVLDPDKAHLATELPCADFVLRDFVGGELVSRCRRQSTRQPQREALLRSGPVTLDLSAQQVRLPDGPIHLPHQQFALLCHLVRHAGRVFSREALLQAVWGPEYQGGARTVDIHIARLRVRLGDHGQQNLQTIRQMGYRWQP